MKRNIYSNIKSFGPSEHSEVDNPLTYCMNNTMDQRFLHGGNSDIYGQNSKPCQAFLSDYCADKWDGFCEYASNNKNISLPNNIHHSSTSVQGNTGLTSGEILIKNTAAKKYLISMGDCLQKFEPFDPTVASSPIISYWIPNGYNYSNTCTPQYAVDPTTIDSDIVMDKILSKPIIALDILINIYNTMKKNGTLIKLKDTKIGKFYAENPYFENKVYLNSNQY